MASQALDTGPVLAGIERLLGRQLNAILKTEKLPYSGTKPNMQARLKARVQDYADKQNVGAFNQLKDRIFASNSVQSPVTPRSAHSSGMGPAVSSPRSVNGSARSFGSLQNTSEPYSSSSSIFHETLRMSVKSTKLQLGTLAFKDSPFFTILKPLTSAVDCPVMTSHRHSAQTVVQFSQPDIERLALDKTIRVMVYCAAENGLAGFSKSEIAFPHQVELKVNNDEVKANLKGLKNKPGSTRPADITDLLHKKPKYENSVTLTYALTQKKFRFLVSLVKVHPVEELVNKLKKGKSISREQVIRDMISKAQDADLVATSTVMSLKCPLSTLRMELPCRSTVCTHIQCFDATSFLQLQEQAPTWTCPICNKVIQFEGLVVDQYVNDILQNTPKPVDQVTIEPDGKWSQNAAISSPEQSQGLNIQNGLDDDDIIEIQDIRLTTLKGEFRSSSASGSKTPSMSSREPSASRSSNSKRPIIDLTLSDDDDDDSPPRPTKRTATNNNVSKLPERRNGYKSANSGGRPSTLSFHMPTGNSRSNPSSIGTPDR